jgi:hypothetical protein
LGGEVEGVIAGKELVTQFCFFNQKGKQMKASTLEPRFYEQLHWVKIQYPDLFPPNMNIEDNFGIP